MTAVVTEAKKGKWYKGMPSPNPKGGGKKLFEAVALQELSAHYGKMPGNELLALEADKKRWGRLSVFEQMVVTRLLETYRRDSEGRLNFSEVMDRLIGKPKQSIESEVKITLEQLVMGSIIDATPADNAPLIEAQPVAESPVTDDTK